MPISHAAASARARKGWETRRKNARIKSVEQSAQEHTADLEAKSRQLPPWQYLTLGGKVVTFREHTPAEAKAWHASQHPTKARRKELAAYAERSAEAKKRKPSTKKRHEDAR